VVITMSTAFVAPGDIPGTSRWSRLKRKTFSVIRRSALWVKHNVLKIGAAVAGTAIFRWVFPKTWGTISGYAVSAYHWTALKLGVAWYGTKAVVGSIFALIGTALGWVLGLALVAGIIYLLRKPLGYLGIGLGYVLGFIVAAGMFLLTVVFSVLGFGVLGVLFVVGEIYNLIDTYLIGTFRWLARTDKSLNWRQVNAIHLAEHKDNVAIRLLNWAGFGKLTADVPSDSSLSEGDIVVNDQWLRYPDGSLHLDENDEPVLKDDHDVLPIQERIARNDGGSEYYRSINSALMAKVIERTTKDALNPELEFPGARADITDDADPYTFPGTSFTPNLSIMDDFNASGVLPVEFDFTPYKNHKELLEAFQDLVAVSRTHEERAYWIGRVEMLSQFMGDKTRLRDHGRAWALVHRQYIGQQAEYPINVMRRGFMDMVEELEKQKAPANAKSGQGRQR